MNKLRLYKDSNKDIDVISEYIMSLVNKEDQAKLFALLEKINQGGAKYLVKTQEYNTKKLEDNLFEIKVSKNRFLYCYCEGDIVYIVHAFYKSTRKTPKRDLKLARKRAKGLS